MMPDGKQSSKSVSADNWACEIDAEVLAGFRIGEPNAAFIVKKLAVRKLRSYARRRCVSPEVIWGGAATLLADALLALLVNPDLDPREFARLIDNQAQRLVNAEARQTGGRIGAVQVRLVPMERVSVVDRGPAPDQALSTKAALSLVKELFTTGLEALRRENPTYHAYFCHAYLDGQLGEGLPAPTESQIRRAREKFLIGFVDAAHSYAEENSGERSKQSLAIANYFGSGSRGRTEIPDLLKDMKFLFTWNDGSPVSPVVSGGTNL